MQPEQKDWIKIGTKLVCVESLDVSTDGKVVDYRVLPGTEAEIVGVEGAHVKLSSFDFLGAVSLLRLDLPYFWAPVDVLPAVPREKLSMLTGKRHPSMWGIETKRQHIGFWSDSADPDACSYGARGIWLPWPADHIDLSWDKKERDLVVVYLKEASAVEYWMGVSGCRLCECSLGTTDRGDEAYVWPEGFEHYLMEHGVKPPQEFIDHVLLQEGPTRCQS